MLTMTRPRAALAALSAAALCTGSAHAAPSPQIEQINRATGTSGAFPLLDGPVAFGPTSAVSNDGRFAVFSFGPTFQFEFGNPPVALGDGLHVRDLLLNRTVQIVAGEANFASVDRASRLIGFTTTQQLDPGDTNDAPDLYAFDRYTGRRSLISRANGRRGAALGITRAGAVTRDGRTAIFATAAGVLRRSLLTARNERVSGGQFVDDDSARPYYVQANGSADDFVSADGRVVGTTEGVVTPRRTFALPTFAGFAPALPFVSESGDVAAWQLDDFSSDLTTISTLDTRTGAVTNVPVPASLADQTRGRIVRLTPDGTALILSIVRLATFQQELVSWNLRTGVVRSLGLPVGAVSRNLRYSVSTPEPAQAGGLVVNAAPQQRLPGGADVPSPHAYLTFRDRCEFDFETGAQMRMVAFDVQLGGGLPAARSVRIEVWNGDGAKVTDRTVSDAPDTVRAPVGDGSYRVRTTLRLADGRVASEGAARPARVEVCG